VINIKNEFLTCEKLRRAAELGGYEVYPTWLAMKGYCDARGDGFVPDESFDKLPGLPANARKALRSLVECGELSRWTSPGDKAGGQAGGLSRGHGLVDPVPGGWELHDYQDHGVSPLVIEAKRRREREKKSRQRAKLKKAQESCVPTVSPGDRRGDNTRDIAGDIRGDVPVDMEERREPSLSDPKSGSLLSSPEDPPTRSGSRIRKARTVKRQLPAGWAPSEAHREEAKALGVDCDREAQKFSDYCQANARSYADFDAAFRNWLRRASEYGGANKPARTAADDAAHREALRRQDELEAARARKRQAELAARSTGTTPAPADASAVVASVAAALGDKEDDLPW
jgi:hypothetical protein